MTKPKSYRLKHFLDITEIPDDRLDAFIAELPNMVKLMRGLRDKMSINIFGFKIKLAEIEPITWIDDGQHHTSVVILDADNSVSGAPVRINPDAVHSHNLRDLIKAAKSAANSKGEKND